MIFGTYLPAKASQWWFFKATILLKTYLKFFGKKPEPTWRWIWRHKAWKKLYDAQTATLKSISLQDLLDMENEKDELAYSI